MATENDDRVDEALAAAEAVLAARFPKASFAIVAGSILRGEGTASSDIDLVVLHETVPAAWRESFHSHGFPVEAFVHDAETLNWFVDQDAAGGRPVLLDMLADGVAIGPGLARAAALQAEARHRLGAGPVPLTPEQRDALRYQITDLVDDLRDPRAAAETRAIAAELMTPLADLMLRGRGRWSGRGKWLPRLISRMDEGLAERFDAAFRQAAEGRAADLIRLAEEELERHGGLLFDGDRRVAPASARRAGSLIG
ncbi:nucleotidyltransferase domain-containing protein [Ensifer adhaerens]|uniref:nucleotidyltransferase domain-containing protein n=1 Tax=Ensifer adhaerens TaxID=106592 RepID=UPI0023AA0666|nr:nucleotidyltransferase domain-containing protein [Ensifer adhaerens]WDZ78838.1 nucleotidyltransferase domain-containing protein [Ensifer adhaerens]